MLRHVENQLMKLNTFQLFIEKKQVRTVAECATKLFAVSYALVLPLL